MEFVKYAYQEIYNARADSYIRVVNMKLHELFSEYVDSSDTPTYCTASHSHEMVVEKGTQINSGFTGGFLQHIKKKTNAAINVQKTDLENYLEERI